MLRRWINLTILRDFVMNQQPLSMSMYFKYNNKNRPEIKSLSTFDAILAGERTSTTRIPQWYKRNPQMYHNLKDIPVGSELRFSDTQYIQPGTRYVTVKTTGTPEVLTYQGMIDNPQRLEMWSQREGWLPSEGLKLLARNGEGIQIFYEIPGYQVPTGKRIAIPTQLVDNNARPPVSSRRVLNFAQIENDLSSLDAQYQNYLDRQNYGLTGMNNSFYP